MPQPTIFIILRVTCTDAYSHTALPHLQTPTQPRSAPHDHEVENLRRVRPQCLNLSLQAIGCWRWFPASLLEPRFLFKKILSWQQLPTSQQGQGSPHSPPLPGLAGLPPSGKPPSGFIKSGRHPEPFPSCRRLGLRSSVGVCLPPRTCPTPPKPPDGEGEGGGGTGSGGERGCRAIGALSPGNLTRDLSPSRPTDRLLDQD